jgi:hypothetical protein
MITRARWTTDEETYLLEVYNRLNCNGMGSAAIFEELATWDEFKVKNRTKAALQKRHGELVGTKENVINVRVDSSFNEFIQGIQDLKNSYETVYNHNVQLRKRIAELEQKEADFNMMAQIMEQARKMVVNEQLGEHEKPSFKMDRNGNLNRM